MAKSSSIVKAKTFTEFWDQLPAFVKVIIWVAVAVIAYMIGKAIYESYKKKKIQDVLENNTVNVTATGPNGQPVVTSLDLGAKAAVIDDAFHGSWFSEDEEKAITALLGVPKALIPDLSNVYYKLNGKNLKQDFTTYLSTEQWNQVSSLFNA